MTEQMSLPEAAVVWQTFWRRHEFQEVFERFCSSPPTSETVFLVSYVILFSHLSTPTTQHYIA